MEERQSLGMKMGGPVTMAEPSSPGWMEAQRAQRWLLVEMVAVYTLVRVLKWRMEVTERMSECERAEVGLRGWGFASLRCRLRSGNHLEMTKGMPDAVEPALRSASQYSSSAGGGELGWSEGGMYWMVAV